MTDPVRFPANVPYEMWPELYAVFAALDADDVAEAQRRWNASTKTPDGTYCERAAGAIQMGYKDFFKPEGVKVKRRGTISNGTPTDFEYIPGEIAAFEATTAGDASASASGGSEWLYGGVFATMPAVADPLDPKQFTTSGHDAIMGLPILPGQFLLLYQVKQAAGITGRADVR